MRCLLIVVPLCVLPATAFAQTERGPESCSKPAIIPLTGPLWITMTDGCASRKILPRRDGDAVGPRLATYLMYCPTSEGRTYAYSNELDRLRECSNSEESNRILHGDDRASKPITQEWSVWFSAEPIVDDGIHWKTWSVQSKCASTVDGGQGGSDVHGKVSNSDLRCRREAAAGRKPWIWTTSVAGPLPRAFSVDMSHFVEVDGAYRLRSGLGDYKPPPADGRWPEGEVFVACSPRTHEEKTLILRSWATWDVHTKNFSGALTDIDEAWQAADSDAHLRDVELPQLAYLRAIAYQGLGRLNLECQWLRWAVSRSQSPWISLGTSVQECAMQMPLTVPR